MMKAFWIRFWKETEGQDLVEYALIVSLIAVALIGALTFMSGQIKGIF